VGETSSSKTLPHLLYSPDRPTTDLLLPAGTRSLFFALPPSTTFAKERKQRGKEVTAKEANPNEYTVSVKGAT